MKKSILFLLFISTLTVNAQYCAFYEFEAKEPDMVVSTLKGMMETGWGKGIKGTKSLLGIQFNGTNKATHIVQFCFPDEAALADFMSSWALSVDAQLFGDKLAKFTENVTQALNTPIWYKNDWSNDQAFMIYQLDVSNPGAYAKEFISFSQKMGKKMNYTENSYGIGFPIIGKTEAFSHFVWMGFPDVKTALTMTKQMLSDPMFTEFSAKVSPYRKLVNTLLYVRLMDF